MFRYVVVASKGNNQFSSVTKLFEDDGDELKKYIELKVNAGFDCHKFDHQASFKKESRIIQS
jgi:hypothetical protein